MRSPRWMLFILIPILVIVGSATGVYLGFSLTHKPRQLPLWSISERPTVEPEMQFVYQVGERFPAELFTTVDGSKGRFDVFFDGDHTVLLFWHGGCGACLEQAETWNRYMEPVLREGVKQVVCWPNDLPLDRAKQWSFVDAKTVVFIDYYRFVEAFNLVFSPTIIALDGQGIISHIQYEESPFFDEELAQLLTDVAFKP